jgi:hypothetical protein
MIAAPICRDFAAVAAYRPLELSGRRVEIGVFSVLAGAWQKGHSRRRDVGHVIPVPPFSLPMELS